MTARQCLLPAPPCAGPLQVLAPFGALLSRRFPLTPMTDNACVSIHAVGLAAEHSNSNGATMPTSTNTSSSSSSPLGVSSRKELDPAAQVELLAITEDPWGSYLLDPETLETLEQVGVSLGWEHQALKSLPGCCCCTRIETSSLQAGPLSLRLCPDTCVQLC